MAEIQRIGNTSSEFLVDVPVKPTTTAVVFLPGVSGEAFSERFQPLADACLGAGFAIARVNAWNGMDDIKRKNLGAMCEDIDAVIAYLQQQGYTNIFGIGKSFGGAVMLTHTSPHIQRKVLWAPAIGVTASGANVDAFVSTPLGNLKSPLELKVDRRYLENKNIPTLIIHGTADENVPFSNSEALVSMLPSAKLLPIAGADHSYKNAEHEKAVIKATVDFLSE